ncbi:MAG: Hsp70 family protein [Stappiaceae bacterium]
MQVPYCGIDFGTSNSTAAIISEGRPLLIPLDEDKTVCPSALFFNSEDRQVYFGKRAHELYIEGVEGRLMRALKTVLGSALMKERTVVLNEPIPFPEIIGHYIGMLKRAIDDARQDDVRHVVLGRPVHFVDDDSVADRRAQDELEEIARAQGFSDVSFQYEPIAAALDYEQQVEKEEVALIIDLGGGTADYSIVRVSPDRAKAAERNADVLANTGVHVGGTDFDRLLSLAEVMPMLGYRSTMSDGRRLMPNWPYDDLATWHRINFMYSEKVMRLLKELKRDAQDTSKLQQMIELVDLELGHALAAQVETIKIRLSDSTEEDLVFPLSAGKLETRVLVENFDRSIERAVRKLGEALEHVLTLAQLNPAQIDTVFLTGGSASIPFVRRSLLARVPHAKMIAGDVFGSVGTGLGLDAKRKFS